MLRSFGLTGLCMVASLGVPVQTRAGAKQFAPEQLRFFEANIRPLLIDQCQKCHGAKKQQGNLRLDSREHTLKGGDGGPAVVPGQPEKSLLIRAVRHTSKNLRMPDGG